MNKKSLFIIPLSVLMLVGCNGKNSGGSTTSQEPTFTVVWKNYDGTVLETDTGLKKGETPTYDSAEPSRAASAQYTFTFTGWSPEVVAVTQDAEYTATYREDVNSYTVTWVVDGVEVKTQTVEYGTTVSWTEDDPSKASTAEYDYTFTGWDYDLANPITGNTTITAEFSSQKRSYTITFLNDNGAEIEHHSVEYGEMPVCETTPEKEGTVTYNYDFAGWDNEIATVTGEATYTATYNAVPLDFSLIERSEELGGNYYRCNGLKNNAYAGEVNIPSTYKGLPVESIYDSGFNSCPGITSVTIPSSVKDIGNSTFKNSSITSVSIPGSVKMIKQEVFFGCEKLTNVELHEGTESIGLYAFYKTAIREFKLVESLKSVDTYAFMDCAQLTRIETASGDSLKNCTFSTSAFYKTTHLTEVINNTASMTHNEVKNIFKYPTNNYIWRVTDSANKGTFEYEETAANEGDVKRIFYTYPGDSEIYLVGSYGSGTTLRTGKATYVKNFAFRTKENITQIYIGSSLKNGGLRQSAFGAMPDLTTITFEGDGYLEIGSDCFRDNAYLTTINWGTRKIVAIHSLAFAGCNLLVFTLPTAATELILYGDCFDNTANTSITLTKNVKAIDSNPFLNMPNLTAITVDSENQYFKAIDGVLFTIDGKTLVCYPENKAGTSYAVPSGVEIIGSYAMNGLANLTSLALPSSITELGYGCLIGYGTDFPITFEGTVAEFSAIKGVNTWWVYSGTQVTCSDGVWTKA